MNQCRRLIDRISQLLMTGDAKSRQAVEPLAMQYVELTQKANERFQRCAAYLAEGNRSEAVRECEEAPNLLDLFAALNFPQRDIWEATIAFHELPPPERLSEPIAQDLNEAYNQEEEINLLLKSHRLLALARRPIAERLPLLRSLSRAEPNEIHWETDIRAMEKVRLVEIENEVNHAFEKRDAKRLLTLERELIDSPWLETPSSSLLQKATRCSTTIHLENTKQELMQLEQQLNEAYSAQDVARGRQLRSHWYAKLRLADLAPEDPLLQQVRDALAWLDEEDERTAKDSEHRQTIAALTEALDREAGRMEIKRLHEKAKQLNRGIPNVLDRRATEWVAYLDRKKRLIATLAGVFVATAILVVGGITWFSISQNQFNRQVAGHLSNIEILLDENRLDEAKSYFEKIEQSYPSIFATPEIQESYSAWNESVQKEQQRVDNLSTAIQKTKKQIEKGDWNSLLAAEQSLANLRSQAQPGQEANTVADMEDEVLVKKQTLQKNIDNQYNVAFTAWKQKVQNADQSNLDALRGLESEGWNLLRSGKNSTPAVSASYQSLTSNLARKIGVWREATSQTKASQEVLKELDRSVGNPQQFSAILRQYRTRFLPEAGAIENDTDMKTYETLRKMNSLVERIGAEPLSKIDPDTAGQILKQCKSCKQSLEKYVGHPLQAISPQYMQTALAQYITILESIAARKKDGAWITDELNSVLGKPLIIRLKSVRVSKGNEDHQYYFRDPPFPNKGSSKVAWTFKTYLDFNLEDTSPVRINQTNILNQKLKEDFEGIATFDWAAPQKKVADILLTRTNRIKQGGDWEAEFGEALEVLNSDSHLEPLLKIQLLQIVAEIAAKGSVFMEAAIKPELKLLENPPIDFNANWIDPNDEDGKSARAQAKIILGQIRSFKPLLTKTLEKRDTFNTSFDKRLTWVGYLWKDDHSGQWTCRPSNLTSGPVGDLYVLLPPSGDAANQDKTTVRKIGEISHQSQEKVLSLTTSSGLARGCPVYLLQTKEPSK